MCKQFWVSFCVNQQREIFGFLLGFTGGKQRKQNLAGASAQGIYPYLINPFINTSDVALSLFLGARGTKALLRGLTCACPVPTETQQQTQPLN